jgi:hypothetical protein
VNNAMWFFDASACRGYRLLNPELPSAVRIHVAWLGALPRSNRLAAGATETCGHANSRGPHNALLLTAVRHGRRVPQPISPLHAVRRLKPLPRGPSTCWMAASAAIRCARERKRSPGDRGKLPRLLVLPLRARVAFVSGRRIHLGYAWGHKGSVGACSNEYQLCARPCVTYPAAGS